MGNPRRAVHRKFRTALPAGKAVRENSVFPHSTGLKGHHKLQFSLVSESCWLPTLLLPQHHCVCQQITERLPSMRMLSGWPRGVRVGYQIPTLTLRPFVYTPRTTWHNKSRISGSVKDARWWDWWHRREITLSFVGSPLVTRLTQPHPRFNYFPFSIFFSIHTIVYIAGTMTANLQFNMMKTRTIFSFQNYLVTLESSYTRGFSPYVGRTVHFFFVKRGRDSSWRGGLQRVYKSTCCLAVINDDPPTRQIPISAQSFVQ